VAVAIKAEGKTYVLDKYLPLATIDKWHNKWNKKWYSPKKVEKINENRLEPAKLSGLLSNETPTELDKVKIASEMKRLLNINKYADNPEGGTIKLMQWKKGAILYDDDEIVSYSLAQRLKTIMANEMIEANMIGNLEVDQKKNDLIFRLSLK
jgi:predicted transglutaminase-like protease